MLGVKLFIPLLLSLCLIAAMQAGAKDSARAFSSTPAEAVKARSLCSQGERVVWSCETLKERKIASLCSSKDLDRTRGYVQYRYGRAGQVELEFPGERANSQAAFKYSRYTRPLVTFLKVEFVNNGFTYTISDDDNEEEKPARRDASITVSPSGANAKETALRCRLPVTGSLMTLEDALPNVDYQGE
jgi:hypothetical protein